MVGDNQNKPLNTIQSKYKQLLSEHKELLDDYEQLEKYCELIEKENNELAWLLAGYEGAYD